MHKYRIIHKQKNRTHKQRKCIPNTEYTRNANQIQAKYRPNTDNTNHNTEYTESYSKKAQNILDIGNRMLRMVSQLYIMNRAIGILL